MNFSQPPPPIGRNIMNFRKKKNMSLDELSKRSGVSKSMLFQIEQERTNPTVITVWKIARALDVSVEELLESKGDYPIEVLRYEDASLMYSDDNSCEIRVTSPIHMTDNFELYQLTFKPWGILKSEPHFPKAEEFVTVVSGRIKVSAGKHTSVLNQGDTGRYRADQHHSIENPTDEQALAFLVVCFPK